MKHSALSMLLLLGIGLAPALGLLGGGSINYGKGDPEVQQSAGDAADEVPTKENTGGNIAREQTAENQGIDWCTGDKGSTCNRDAKPAQ